MLTIEFQNCGAAAEVLRPAEREISSPKFGELRVRMLCSPINPSDLLFISGQYTTKPSYPQIPGFEGVGIVEAAGGGWRGRLFQGKRVVVLHQHGGTWAEQTIVPDSHVVPVPSFLTDVQAASSFVNPMTAWMMIHNVLKISRGAWLIQTASGSILGRMIIRLGQHLGIHTVNVVRSEKAEQRCRAVGAKHVIRWDAAVNSAADLQHQVADLVKDSRLMFAVDAVSGDTGSAVLQCLSPNGKFLAYGTLSHQPLAIPTRQMMSNQWIIDSFWLGHRMQAMNLISKLVTIKKVQKMIRTGILETPVSEVFPIGEFQSAIRRVQGGHSDDYHSDDHHCDEHHCDDHHSDDHHSEISRSDGRVLRSMT